MAIPNLLDWLRAMRDETNDEQSRKVLGEAYLICAKWLAGQPIPADSPPSWPLNLDEWEVDIRKGIPQEPGWWAMLTDDDHELWCVRRKPRPAELTLSEEK